MLNTKSSFLKLSTILLTSICFTACASYRSVEDASKLANLPDMNQTFSEVARFNDHEPVELWWDALEDKSLSLLIKRALEVNYDLRIALASVNESRAILRRDKLEYAPSIATSLSSVREKQAAEFSNKSQSISEYYTAGFESSWELDLFGRIKNQVRLSNAQLVSREADLKATQVSVAAEVASVYLELRGNQQLIDIAERSVEIQNQNLHMIREFTMAGRTTNFDLARAKAQLELTAAQLPSLQKNYQLSLSRLSILTVIPVNSLSDKVNKEKQFPLIPPSVPVGDFSDLLKRRPDVVRAEQALKGATAEYNINVSLLYPRVNLLGSFGFMSSQWSELGQKESEAFRFSPSIHWAALDFGRVKSHINAADAKAQGSLAAFEKTVLVALQETNDAFARFSSEEQRMQRLLVAATESSNASEFARKTYQKGKGNLRDVLDAEQVRLNTASQLVTSEMNILLNLVDIYKNLGGGWNTVAIN